MRKRSSDSGCCAVIFLVGILGFLLYMFTSIYVFSIIMTAIICIIIIVVARNQKKAQEIERNLIYTINDIDMMSGEQFEYAFSRILRRNGYTNVRVTQTSGDNGIDVLASYNGLKLGFQCKCFSQHVGNKAVQEAFTGRHMYDLDKTIVVTNNYFTASAMQTARTTGVELWDRDKLCSLLVSGSNNPDTDPAVQSSPQILALSENKLTDTPVTHTAQSNKATITRNSPTQFTSQIEEPHMYDPENGIFPAGEYIVGEDMPTGKYLLQSRPKATGYISWYSSIKDMEERNILRNHLFNGDFYVNLRKIGEVIEVSGADMQKLQDTNPQINPPDNNSTPRSYADCKDAQSILNLILENPEGPFHTGETIHALQEIVNAERLYGNMKRDAIAVLDKASKNIVQ